MEGPYRTAGRELSELEKKAIDLEEKAKKLIEKMEDQEKFWLLNPNPKDLVNEVEAMLKKAGYRTIYRCTLKDNGFNSEADYICKARGKSIFIYTLVKNHFPESHYHIKPFVFIPEAESEISQIRLLPQQLIFAFTKKTIFPSQGHKFWRTYTLFQRMLLSTGHYSPNSHSLKEAAIYPYQQPKNE